MLVEHLKRLCDLHGVDVVAEKARVSADNLKQILVGTKLPSGQPRGVGPQVADKLEKAFPNWARLQPVSEPKEATTVNATVQHLMDLLAGLDDDALANAAKQLQKLADSPDSTRARDSLIAALSVAPVAATPTKPRRAA